MAEMRYLPQLEEVHASWFDVWGNHIGSERLGAEIFSNPRLHKRAYDHFLASSDLDLEAGFTMDEVNAFRAYASQRERLLRTCGLVMHGRVFRESISRTGFDQLTKLIPADELRIAVAMRHLHPATDGLEIDLQRISELVERSGRHCIDAWISGMPEQTRLRADLMSDATTAQQSEVHEPGPKIATQIVTEVSKALIMDGVMLAA